MPKLSELALYNRFPWAVPLKPAIDPDEGFYDVQPWQFPEPVLELIEQMFTEVDNFFKSTNLPFELTIFEIKEVFGYLDISSLTPHAEVTAIFLKYRELSKEFFQ
ncbi:hypothetical protein [Paenibacillus piri]|uniref:Uncharacterized protein n=1 Tax=Paenibacillus piri TaxID=2547395 RepID=A0A4R5L069_9BACL|nr:hypothetical protein [Paenibacillus piri]TDG00868.1 hypothetical protein E1757_04460 [Paenibacillus piri]